MLFLTNEHIQQVLNMETCIAAMEDAYGEINEQRAGYIARASISTCRRSRIIIAGARWRARRASSVSSPFE